ncbi:MAG TPA: aminotransferase class I/II-fold pyridoxal phosphate-dependent enzyme [Dinghuibacter sp.]|jgi:aspartate/methionine/tyrosine aminotransferase|uniref:pyridoxal phosphate-dependent aminotransferase n=1 Tax=Dinghuibacter sp. TaxID=2024697 RepID=UPI002BF9C3BE|nr:aminotransferase class I/II-fold pyridoxal phosphate-dependent enzyme [Dinghuibacter sp.]HTJ13955.1 aminotransferase class I/II-fold pyridoxal phosphate-dependent enzyme [Dinghuibacter sp.]
MTAKRLEGIGEYYFSTKLREIDELNKQGKQVINLGIGSPDLPPHPEVIKTLQEAAARPDTHAYQNYKGSPILRKAVAGWYKIWYGVELDPETEILPLIGSKEGIMHICMTYLNEGDEALIPNPGYPTYSAAVKLAGGTAKPYTLSKDNQWAPDFESLEQTDLSKVKLMWVNYPHMPTGQKASDDLFEKIVDFGRRHDILICHDNPYSFILNDHPQSLLKIKGAKDVVLELNSLSKSHNMAGWRIGTLSGARERINEVLRFKSNMDSGMFLPMQLAAATALGLGKDWYDSVNAVYAKRRQRVFELLDLLRCAYDKDQVGMFVWAAIPDSYKDGYAVSDAVLYKSNVFITPGGIFGTEGNGYVRVSLCCTEEKLIQSMERIKGTKWS